MITTENKKIDKLTKQTTNLAQMLRDAVLELGCSKREWNTEDGGR